MLALSPTEQRGDALSHVSIYVQAICAHALQSSKPRRKHPSSLFKRICNAEGCNTCIHALFWKDGLCYFHGTKETKLCVKCKKSTASKAGHLCRPCHGKKDKGLCSVCGSREPWKVGGRCLMCTHMQYKDSSRKLSR